MRQVGMEAALRKKLDNEATFERTRLIGMRDNRACWLWQSNLETIRAIRLAAPWLRGETELIPGQMISDVLRPGDDNDLRQLHQRRAFARAVVEGGDLDTHNFLMMKITDYMLIDAIEAIAVTEESREARRLLDAWYDYQERARKNGHKEEVLRRTLEGKADAYCAVLKQLSGKYREWELARCGETELTASEQMIMERVDSIAREVAIVARHTQTPPASSRTQKWVMERWRHANAHPESLVGAHARRRVYVRDVWDAVHAEAKTLHGITSFAEFRKILRTAKQGRRRSLGASG